MATFNPFNQFIADAMNGVHDLSSDQLTVALTATTNAPTATNAVLTDITEITYTNLTARNITTSSSTQTGGTYKLILADLTLTATTGNANPFRYVVIYNNTPTNPADPLICWYDYGSALTLSTNESLLIDFDATNGLFQATATS